MVSGTIVVSIKILTELAPKEPITSSDGVCVFCHQVINLGTGGTGHAMHCPWVRARGVLKACGQSNE